MRGWLVCAVVAIAVYATAYFALLEGKQYRGPISTNPVTGANKFIVEPRYRIGGYTKALFAPIHASTGTMLGRIIGQGSSIVDGAPVWSS
jgi:hypothetical protein